MKKETSSPNTASTSLKLVLLIHKIIFGVNLCATIKLSIIAVTIAIYLFGSFGIGLFSCSKNTFSPFFIFRPVKYMMMYTNAKFINNTT